VYPVVQHARSATHHGGHGGSPPALLRAGKEPVAISAGDGGVYLLGAILGLSAGVLDLEIGDLLLTALLVLAATMLLGALRPEQPWRWTVEVAAFVPLMHWLAYLFLTQRPDRAHMYESFLGFLTGIAGAYGGAVGRKGFKELFGK